MRHGRRAPPSESRDNFSRMDAARGQEGGSDAVEEQARKFRCAKGLYAKKNERRRRRRMRMREEGEEITWAFLALTLAVVQ